MSPAERLLAAADLLDRRAGEATEGPWGAPGGPRYVFLDGFSGHDVDGPKGGFVARGSYWADARYIATMHPEVGKALAALLRWEADAVAFNDGRRALAIADLILASAS